MGEVVADGAGNWLYYDGEKLRATLTERHLRMGSCAGGPPLEYRYRYIRDVVTTAFGAHSLNVVVYTENEISPGFTFEDASLGHEFAGELWSRAVADRYGGEYDGTGGGPGGTG